MDKTAAQLITERLFLNEIAKEDTPFIVKWRSNPVVYQYFVSPHPLSAEEHLAWFRTRYVPDENRFDWMAVEKGTGKRIGVFGIKREENSASVEINYILAPECQGRGYAREAVCRMLEFAKEFWKSEEAVAEIHVENKESLKFAEGLGFAYEGRRNNFVLYKKRLGKLCCI